jgi:chlorite dismutase
VNLSVVPSEGWGVLHLFFRASLAVDAEAVAAALKSCEADGHTVVPFAVLGHKGDLGVMALGPDFWRLQQLQADLVAADLELVDSYLSMTEVSEYAKGMPPEQLEPRLHPQLPPSDATVVCFYPMSKRREQGANWYSLAYADREKLMYGHGKKAREFKGRIVQLVTASTGLDDWEWAVTLFSSDPLAIKQCVHELRFDEASSIYAEFGTFVIGLLAPIDEVLRRVGLA